MEKDKSPSKPEVEANRSGALIIGTVGATCCVGSVAILGALSLPVSLVAATGVSVGLVSQRFINRIRSDRSEKKSKHSS